MADRYSYSYRRDHTEFSHTSSHFFTSSNNPSFSSTLLEEIYRSIDLQGEDEMVICRESMRKKRDDANLRAIVFKSEEEMANYQRACMIEKWMEKKVTEKIVIRGKPVDDLQVKMSRKDRQGSSSCSSDSSCSSRGSRGSRAGFFSSSEAESFPVVHRQKPVRTGGEPGKNHRETETDRRDRRGFGDQSEQKPKHESGFLKTKSRALKIYGDLKKVKQPISPGGKVAAFLNSLFTAGNLRKPKIAAACGGDSPSVKSASASTCSSASSFSRSCLSKTPSSKSSGGAKRSVRFSPVSVVVDQDCQHIYLHKENNDDNNNNNNNDDDMKFTKTTIGEELMMRIMEKNRRVEEAARDFLMQYHKKDCEYELPFDRLTKIDVENRGFDQEFDEEEDEDDEFDVASYASSDLFELDNLSAIGMERYTDELPVYETTNIDKIQNITNGLIL